MNKTTVKTEKELKQAIEKNVEEISIDNPELASKLKSIDTLRKCSPYAAGLAVTAIIAFASTPISGPVGPSVGVIAFGGAAIATGLSVTTLVAIGILAGVIGVVVFWAIYNDYEIIEVDASTGKITLRLKKNK